MLRKSQDLPLRIYWVGPEILTFTYLNRYLLLMYYNIWYLITGSDGRSSKSNSESSSSSEEISKVISTKDFQIVQKLGVGGFGNVFLAKYRQNTGKSKGQLISECLFEILQKTNAKIWWISALESKNWLNWINKGPFYILIMSNIAPNY